MEGDHRPCRLFAYIDRKAKPTMAPNQYIVVAIALIGITAGSFCLARWAKYPEAADFKLKAYAIFNTTVGTFSLTYVLIHVLKGLLR